MNNKRIATAALDEAFAEDRAMTLKEHDHIYHHDHYTGGECLFRDQMALGDAPEEALARANELESSQIAAKEQERNMIGTAFIDNLKCIGSVKTRKQNGAAISIGDQDENGDVVVKISMNPDCPANAITRDKVREIVEGEGREFLTYSGSNLSRRDEYERKLYGIGYKLKGFKSGIVQGKKRVFLVKMHKDARVGALSPEALSSLAWRPVVENAPEMSLAEKSLALKRYGLKLDENGKAVPRISREEETPQERYLRMVNEGRTIPRSNAEIKRLRELKKKEEEAELERQRDEAMFKRLGFD